MMWRYIETFYQTLHFFAGFIREPVGQLKASANSLLFERVPSTRIRLGE